ncbi:MAG: YhbY family RNA-binding protein [Gemmatimonadetes bacterium]|nr:YhbY family RNA-binding protein [Gemmatimonadota bacterium]
MTESTLRGKQRRYLRGLGVNLEPKVWLGGSGLTEAFLASVEDALSTDELIKVKLPELTGADRKAAAKELAEKSGTELIQVLGRTALLYRRNDEKPEIQLPA